MKPLRYSRENFILNSRSTSTFSLINPANAELIPLNILFKIKNKEYSSFPLSHFFDFPKDLLNDYINAFLLTQDINKSKELIDLCFLYFVQAIELSGLNTTDIIYFNFKQFLTNASKSQHSLKQKIFFITNLFTQRSEKSEPLINQHVLELYEKIIYLFNQPVMLFESSVDIVENNLNISILSHLCSPLTPFFPESEKTKKTNYLQAHLPGLDYKKIITSFVLSMLFGPYKIIKPTSVKINEIEAQKIIDHFMQSHEFYMICTSIKALLFQPISISENYALIDELFQKKAPVSSNLLFNAQTYLSLFKLHLHSDNLLCDHFNNVLGTTIPLEFNLKFIEHLVYLSNQSPHLFDGILLKNTVEKDLDIIFENTSIYLSMLPNNLEELTEILLCSGNQNGFFSTNPLSKKFIEHFLARAPLYDIDLIKLIKNIAETKKVKINQIYYFEELTFLLSNILDIYQKNIQIDILSWSREALNLRSIKKMMRSNGFLYPLLTNLEEYNILSNALLHILSLPEPNQEKIKFIFSSLSEDLLISGLSKLKSAEPRNYGHSTAEMMISQLIYSAAKDGYINLMIFLLNEFKHRISGNRLLLEQMFNTLIANKNFIAIFKVIEQVETKRLIPFFNLIFNSLQQEIKITQILKIEKINIILLKFLRTEIPLKSYIPYLNLIKLDYQNLIIDRIDSASFKEKIHSILELCLYQSLILCDFESIYFLSKNGITLRKDRNEYSSLGLFIFNDNIFNQLLNGLHNKKLQKIYINFIDFFQPNVEKFLKLHQKNHLLLGSKKSYFFRELPLKKEDGVNPVSLKSNSHLIFKKEKIVTCFDLKMELQNKNRHGIDILISDGIARQLNNSILLHQNIGIPISLRTMLIDHLILRYKEEIPIHNKEIELAQLALTYQDPIVFECLITLPELDLSKIKIFNDHQFLLGYLIEHPTFQNIVFFNKLIKELASSNYSKDDILSLLTQSDRNNFTILDYCHHASVNFLQLDKIISLCTIKKINPLYLLSSLLEIQKSKGMSAFDFNLFLEIFKKSYNFFNIPESKVILERIDYLLNNFIFEHAEKDSIESRTTEELIKIIIDKIENFNESQKNFNLARISDFIKK